MTNYTELNTKLEALFEGVNYTMANLANASAALNEEIPDINWVGFYTIKHGKLVLGPFQGKVACTTIEIGKGVCGSAVEKDCTLSVSDVHQFSGHIACDSASRSEVVIPLHRNGKIWGVLDIDSPIEGRFTEEDATGLEMVAKTIEKAI